MTAEPALQPVGHFIIRDAQGQIQRAPDAMPLIFGSREEAERMAKELRNNA